MDYKRTRHWAKYDSDKCKMYLRNDFHFECAYCRMREQDNAAGEKIFEKDHFISKKTESRQDLNDYDNMVYACCVCNGTKTDQNINLILDPCKDDIYGGESPHIETLGMEGQYRLHALTCKGQMFIDSLQLNSRFYRKMRRKQAENLELRNAIRALLEDIKADEQPEVAVKLESMLEMDGYQDENSDEFRCGISKAGEELYSVLKKLDEKQIEYQLLFDDYDLDVMIRFHGTTYYCEVKSSRYTGQNRRGPHVEEEKKERWLSTGHTCGILYYYKNMDRLELYVCSDEKDIKKRYRL